MITIHVMQTILDGANSCYDSKAFDFNGQNDAAVEEAIKDCFFNMKASGGVNVQCMSEDSQVPDDSTLCHLRWGKPYMFNNGGNVVKYVADLSFDQITPYLQEAA